MSGGWRWQDAAAGAGLMDELHPTRRVVGLHDIRFDGLSDLFLRARGASIIDIGCNRGHVAYDFALNGARLVHGCDIYGPGIMTARQWFAELPHCESKFEVVDLAGGRAALSAAFGAERYDIVIFLGTYHKLVRVMEQKLLSELIRDMGNRAVSYFAFTGYTEHLAPLDADLKACALKRIHTSELALPGRPAAIWARR